MPSLPSGPSALPTWLHARWQAARESLWLVPAAMILGALALGLLMVRISGDVDHKALVHYPRLFGASPDSSREMLSVIAAAMMTVTSVTFSITMVAVSQAASQYSSRILRHFMRDRANQVALGTFTGVFVYCLVILRTVRSDQDLRFNPEVAVIVAVVLAILAIGVLVFFIHHVAQSLQATTILARVADETRHAVEQLFPDAVGEEPSPAQFAAAARTVAHLQWHSVQSAHTGYLLGVDGQALTAFAADRDLVVKMERAIGEHVVEGTPLASANRPLDDEEAAALRALFAIARFRTIAQDPAFGLRELADVAVRALSPGINSTSTATTALDNIGAVLFLLTQRRVDDPHRVQDGRVRVVTRAPSFARLVATGLHEIRRNAAGNYRVLLRLLDTLALLLAHTGLPARRTVLLEEAHRVHALAQRSVEDASDRVALAAFYRERFELGQSGP